MFAVRPGRLAGALVYGQPKGAANNPVLREITVNLPAVQYHAATSRNKAFGRLILQWTDARIEW